MNDIMTVKEAAEMLRGSLDHVHDLLVRGELDEFRDGRRRKVFSQSLQDYIGRCSRRRQEPEDDPSPTPPCRKPGSGRTGSFFRQPVRGPEGASQ
jgi:excisionase family DNA binding protein